MAAPAGQLAPRLLLFLGGTLAALAGAFTGMGVPEVPGPPPLGRLEEATGPAQPPILPQAGAPARPERVRPAVPPEEPAGPVVAGRLHGPSGPVAQAPVALVPLPVPGAPERARLIQLTGLDGSFSFPLRETAGGCFALHFQVPGFGLHARPVLEGGGRAPQEVLLAYGRWLPGHACRRDGTPLPGTRILVGLPLATAGGPRVLWTDSGLAGPEGGFVARDLPPGEKILLLGEHPECAPGDPLELWAPASGPTGELALILSPGVDLAGLVVGRAGAPAARVRIGWESIHAGGLRIRRDAISAEDGRFLLRGLPTGVQGWTLELIGPEGRRRKVDLPAGPWACGVRLQVPW